MTRSRRTRLARSIYADAYGVAAIACAGPLRRELRFPPDTPLDEVKAALDHARAALREDLAGHDAADPTRDTLAGDVARYLKTRAGRSGAAADACHLHAWLVFFPHERRNRIGLAQAERAVAAWRDAGVAARTIRHRVRALRELLRWTTRRRRTVIDDLVLPPLPRPAPRAVPLAAVRKTARALKRGDPKDYARFLVRWTTGQRPAEIMRAQPADVDLRKRLWFVRAAKGGDPHPVALTAGAVTAWRLFKAADAWGAFDTSAHAKALRAAGWPDGVRPYELRHTLAIQVLEDGGDLGDVQAALGHRSIETTRLFYGAMQITRAKRVARQLGRHHRW